MAFSMYFLNMHPLLTDLELSIFLNISSYLSQAKSNEILTNNQQDLIIIKNITITSCNQGEIYLNFLGSCATCPKGTYSFNINDNFCQSCPYEAVLCASNTVELRPSYWRSPKTQKIYECFPFAESCL